jgi:hypothetical protein
MHSVTPAAHYAVLGSNRVSPLMAYNIILLNVGEWKSFMSWGQTGNKYKWIVFNFFWFTTRLIIRSYCIKHVESYSRQGVIIYLGNWMGLTTYQRNKECDVTKCCVEPKIWVGCLERPMNIRSVYRLYLLKTGEDLVGVENVWRKRWREATTWRCAYRRIVSAMWKLCGHDGWYQVEILPYDSQN